MKKARTKEEIDRGLVGLVQDEEANPKVEDSFEIGFRAGMIRALIWASGSELDLYKPISFEEYRASRKNQK